MKTTLSIIGIASLALVGFSTEALAQGPRDIKSEQCLASVPLSRQQDRQIDGLRAVAWQKSRHLSAQIDWAEAELRALTLRPRPNRIAIARKEGDLRALRARERSVWVTYRLQVEAVLGPMQRMTVARCASAPPPIPVAVGPARNGRPLPPVIAQAPVARPMGRR
jgi:Spy/CpxP family protein refolding chaperone